MIQMVYVYLQTAKLAEIFSTSYHNIITESQIDINDISLLFTWNRGDIYDVIEIQ